MTVAVRGPRAAAGLVVAGLVVEFALLAAWQRNGYWGFSDGVYAVSAREWLGGLVPYRAFAAAQPPPVYLVGMSLLAIHDGLTSLRAGLALLDSITAALVGLSVWRITRRRLLSWAAALAAPLMPVSLASHAQLTPETLAAPLLLAGALSCSRAPRATMGGVLLGLATLCKLAFALPALAIALAASRRRRALVSLAGATVGLAAIALAVFGTDAWREVVTGQLEVGAASLHYVGGLLAQASWNEWTLVVGAVAALLLANTDGYDRDLVRTLGAAALAGLLLALTVIKRGSYINVLAVAEPPLLALAVSGAAWTWRRWHPARPLVLLLAGFLAAQPISILANPGNPWAATRPGARSGLEWTASPAAVDRAVAAARRCPARTAYSGVPYIAFLADRRMPGNQPDPFVLEHASTDASFARRAARDIPRCPPS